MKTKFVKIISMCIVAVLLLGCGSGNNQSSSQSATSGQSTSQQNTDNVFSGNDFSIEEISVRNEAQASFYHTRVKVRNNSDHYINNMKIRYQVLDKSGDVIAEGDYYISDLEPGVAITVEDQAKKGDGDFSKVAAYKFVNFEVREYDDTKLYKEFRFNPSIVIEVKDFGTYSK